MDAWLIPLATFVVGVLVGAVGMFVGLAWPLINSEEDD